MHIYNSNALPIAVDFLQGLTTCWPSFPVPRISFFHFIPYHVEQKSTRLVKRNGSIFTRSLPDVPDLSPSGERVRKRGGRGGPLNCDISYSPLI